jgi:hypothetical protein
MKNFDIIFQQETHVDSIQLETECKRQWEGLSVWARGATHSRGVAVLFKKGLWLPLKFLTYCILRPLRPPIDNQMSMRYGLFSIG